MKNTNDIPKYNELIQKLEGIDDEQKISMLVEFIKENEKKNENNVLRNFESIDCYADIYKYLQFLEGYKYKYQLLELLADDETFNKFKEECPKEKLDIVSEIIADHSTDEKLELIKDFIRKYEKAEKFSMYYDRGGAPSEKYSNIDKYIELLDNYDEKLQLAQSMYDFDVAKRILEEYPFTEAEREKYTKLAENNEDIITIIKPKLLSKKYDFLGEKLDFIVNDPSSSVYISELSDEELDFFKLLYDKAEKENAETLHSLWYIPLNIKKRSELTLNICKDFHDNKKINKEIIEKLLWIYTLDYQEHQTIKEDIVSKLNNLEDVSNLEEIIKETCDNIINSESKKENKDTEIIKDALIMSSYGIGLDKVQALLEAYDVSKIELNEENKNTVLMYLAMSQIKNETNADKLITIYNEYTHDNPIKLNYLRDAVFQNELRLMFAKELNNTYDNVQDFEKIDEQDGIQIYDAGTDFKICMTAIGAYQGNFKNQENYFDYWNNKKILSHINCCSLIANNNLASAKITNICLGFSSFDEEMLICGANKDMNSTDSSEYMYGMEYWKSELKVPEELINATRGEYNEIDYERRDLGHGQYYKKNPDYIVFFEEFDNINNLDTNNEEIQQILCDEKRKWQESLKAAKEFGIPIVKINREKCAIAESQKIQENLQKYLETHDFSLLPSIITNFENNRTGTRGHDYLTKKYFSNEKIQNMLNQIVESVNGIQDERLKELNNNEIIKILKKETKNTKNCNLYCDVNKLLGFDSNEYLEMLTNSLEIESEEYER